MKTARLTFLACLFLSLIAALFVSCASASVVKPPLDSESARLPDSVKTPKSVSGESGEHLVPLAAEPESELDDWESLGPSESSETEELDETETSIAKTALPVVPAPPPSIPELILGVGLVSPFHLSAFLLSANPSADPAFVRDLSELYVREAAAEGVNHDVAFSQMCLETGFLKFGGLVRPEMNNFCGLGALGPEKPGLHFLTPRIGVRAHIQHLKGYADAAPPALELVDPRYKWLNHGSAPTIAKLAGRWAQDPLYGEKISGILKRLYALAFGG